MGKTLCLKVSSGGSVLVANVSDGSTTIFSRDTTETLRGKVLQSDGTDWIIFDRDFRVASFYIDRDENFIAYCPSGEESSYFDIPGQTPTIYQILEGETLELNLTERIA